MSADEPEELSNTAVVEAMHSVAAHDTPRARALLFQLLLDTRLVVATRDAAGEPGRRTVGAGEHLDLLTLEGERGQGRVLPVFTSLDTLLAWRPGGGGYLILPGRPLFELAAANDTGGIVIDPGSPTRGTIVRRELEALARGRIPLGTSEVVAEPTGTRIGRPAVPPPADAIEAVRAALDAEPLAVGGFVFLLQQGGTPPELCVGVELRHGVSGGAERAAMRAIVEGAGNRSIAARSLAFLWARDGLLESLAGGGGTEIFRR
jgi:SseB protein N-terminal domain